MILSAYEIDKDCMSPAASTNCQMHCCRDIPAPGTCHCARGISAVEQKILNALHQQLVGISSSPRSPGNVSSLHPMTSGLHTTWSCHGVHAPLVPTLEWVELPVDLAATLRCRSSFGRKGVMIDAGFVDPGFRGQLTLCLVNMGAGDVPAYKNNRVVQMIIP